jgi:hypothetical protein
MSAAQLACWALLAWGFTSIVTLSKLFAPLRGFLGRRVPFLGQLARCAMCFGFWAGVALSLVGVAGPSRALTPGWFFSRWTTLDAGVRAWVDGCASSAVCYVALVVLVALGSEKL